MTDIDVEVRNVHRQRDLLWVLWVGVRLDVGDPERPEEILAGGLASGEPALGVLDLVLNDDLRHGDLLLVARPKIRRDRFGTYPICFAGRSTTAASHAKQRSPPTRGLSEGSQPATADGGSWIGFPIGTRSRLPSLSFCYSDSPAACSASAWLMYGTMRTTLPSLNP